MTGTTNIGFEEKLWQAADKLRSNIDPAEYKHVVLGLIFLKYVSDSFEEKYRVLREEGYGQHFLGTKRRKMVRDPKACCQCGYRNCN